MDTPIMGVIKDFQDSNLVVGAVIKVYASAADVPANPIATSMPSDAMGNWSVTVPKGHYRVIFGNDSGMAITSGGTMVATIPTYEFDRVYSDHDRTAVKASTRDVIQGLVSVVPDPALGVIAGSVRDCANKETGGATVAVSGTSTAYDSASLLFYFKDVSGTTLPNRNQKWTTALGLFAALNVPVGSATATATGQVQESAPKELGAATVPILSGAITIVDVLPLGP
jgi:hypothetical protein